MGTNIDVWSQRMKSALSARWLSTTIVLAMLFLLTNEEAVAQQSQQVDLGADVFFAAGSAVLDQHARAAVELLARKMAVVKLEVVIIVGHADTREASNARAQRLSEQRAKAVKAAFEAVGIEGKKIHVEGKGSKSPVAGNTTPDGRAKNRRAEIEGIFSRPAPSIKQ